MDGGDLFDFLFWSKVYRDTKKLERKLNRNAIENHKEKQDSSEKLATQLVLFILGCFVMIALMSIILMD